MFITGCVNHFGFDILFGFLLLCIKQWLERVLFLFFFLLKAIFRTVEAIFMKDIFIMPRAFLKLGICTRDWSVSLIFQLVNQASTKAAEDILGILNNS